MMPAWPAAAAAFLAAAGFFTTLGLPLARAVVPAGMPPLAAAPSLGWAVSTCLALPLLSLTGFGPWPVMVLAAAALAVALAMLRRPQCASARVPRWCVALAALMAGLPAAAIMPKGAGQGVLLAPPMFDHVKIALVDAILRTGLPVPNPFYGPGGPGRLAYYYLWHFGAAVLGGGLHVGGWTAEAAMTGFTAYASLLLVMGAAMALGVGARGVLAVPLLLLPGSMRPLLAALAGGLSADQMIPRSADIGGWLNQAAWVPQHLASACCLILVCLLMLRLAEGGGLLVGGALGLSAAAAFESSVWVGGIALAAAAGTLGAMLVLELPSSKRQRFLAHLGLAAMLASAFAWPFILDDLHAVAARQAGAGLALSPYHVLGAGVVGGARRYLDLPAFWVVLLPFGLPAIVPLAALCAFRSGAGGGRRRFARVYWVSACACLSVAWLFASTIDNNDLGWRAVLPAILLMAALAAESAVRLAAGRRWVALAAAMGLACLGVPDTARMLGEYAGGQLPGDGRAFAHAQALWQAVRRHTGPSDRVANNVLAVSLATPWPVNIGWALLGDRPSCFAGWESVIAYGAISKNRLIETNDRFARVFDGRARAGDVLALARDDDCAAVAVTDDDGAWLRDPFAAGGIYSLAEQGLGWRIFVRVAK